MGWVSLLEDIQRRLNDDFSKELVRNSNAPKISTINCQKIAKRIVDQAFAKLKACENLLTNPNLDLAVENIELTSKHSHALIENKDLRNRIEKLEQAKEVFEKTKTDLESCFIVKTKKLENKHLRETKKLQLDCQSIKHQNTQLELELQNKCDKVELLQLKIDGFLTETRKKSNSGLMIDRLSKQLVAKNKKINHLQEKVGELLAENAKLKAQIAGPRESTASLDGDANRKIAIKVKEVNAVNPSMAAHPSRAEFTEMLEDFSKPVDDDA